MIGAEGGAGEGPAAGGEGCRSCGGGRGSCGRRDSAATADLGDGGLNWSGGRQPAGKDKARRRRETELWMAEQRSNSRNQALDWGRGRRPAGKDGGAAKELPSHGTRARMEKIQNWEALFAKCYFYSARDK